MAAVFRIRSSSIRISLLGGIYFAFKANFSSWFAPVSLKVRHVARTNFPSHPCGDRLLRLREGVGLCRASGNGWNVHVHP